MRKSRKSEFAQALKTYIPEVLSEVSGTEIPSILITDFMVYCRKVPLRKFLDFRRRQNELISSSNYTLIGAYKRARATEETGTVLLRQ